MERVACAMLFTICKYVCKGGEITENEMGALAGSSLNAGVCSLSGACLFVLHCKTERCQVCGLTLKLPFSTSTTLDVS